MEGLPVAAAMLCGALQGIIWAPTVGAFELQGCGEECGLGMSTTVSRVVHLPVPGRSGSSSEIAAASFLTLIGCLK